MTTPTEYIIPKSKVDELIALIDKASQDRKEEAGVVNMRIQKLMEACGDKTVELKKQAREKWERDQVE